MKPSEEMNAWLEEQLEYGGNVIANRDERIAELERENARLREEFLAVAKAYRCLRDAEPIPPGEPPWASERGGSTWISQRIKELEGE